MRVIAVCIILFASLGVVNAQDEVYENWKELEDFHMSIATIWHPAEEGEFDPVRTRSDELLNRASALKSSDIPEKYDTEEIRNAIGRLQSGANGIFVSLREKNPSDEQLFEELKSLHDVFHEIVGICRDDHDH